MKKSNNGANPIVLIITALIIGVMVYTTFDPFYLFGRAPIVNKIAGWLCLLGAAGFLVASAKDLIFQNSENGNRANWYKIAITAVLIIAALLILGVFHSGALGTTTNPIN
jgi:membrane protease YdiL (CAAX protease family)